MTQSVSEGVRSYENKAIKKMSIPQCENNQSIAEITTLSRQ